MWNKSTTVIGVRPTSDNFTSVELYSKFYVRSFEAKNRVFEFNYEKINMFECVWCSKNDVGVCSMNNLVNLVKDFLVRYLMSVCSKPKFRCSSSIINRWTCSGLLMFEKLMFEFVRCSIKWCSTHRYFLLVLCGLFYVWWSIFQGVKLMVIKKSLLVWSHNYYTINYLLSTLHKWPLDKNNKKILGGKSSDLR